MSFHILVIDNDTALTDELNVTLGNEGWTIQVVDDPNLAMQMAAAERPNLILLAVELPKTNGFAVCNRIKRDPSLGSIPVFVMSADASESTVEQHRRILRTRADEYLKKPFAMASLVATIKRTLLGGAAVEPTPDGGAEVIAADEELELEDDLEPIDTDHPEATTEPAEPKRSDPDVDDMAEQAFHRLMDEPVVSEADLVAGARPAMLPTPSASEELLREARERIAQLETLAEEAESRQLEVERLRRELDDTRAKLSSAGRSGGGAAAREILDLREQLNRKDQELLELRDRITQKDKELLALRESSLVLEREKADLVDRADESNQKHLDAVRHAEAARADKEAAAKRAEDAKRRAEKVTAQLDDRTRELEQERLRSVAVQNQLEQKFSEQLATANQRALVERDAAVAAAEESGRQRLEAAERRHRETLEATEQRLRAERESAVASAETRGRELLEAAERQARDELAGALSNAERRAAEHLSEEVARAVKNTEETARAELERRLRETEQMAADHEQRALADAARDAAERERQALSEQELRLTEQFGAERRTLQDTATAERQALERQLEESRQQSAELHQRWLASTGKWEKDRGNLEKVKDALASALLEVETIEGRTAT